MRLKKLYQNDVCVIILKLHYTRKMVVGSLMIMQTPQNYHIYATDNV